MATLLHVKDSQLASVLERIRRARNVDFREYKRATLLRRIESRMQEAKVGSAREYLSYLDVNPREMDLLLSSMLIKVTSYFRDQDVWERLAKKVIPELLNRSTHEEFRVWCAGCATGEEAFSVAILLAKALGPSFSTARLKVFGTDIDEQAIGAARRGVYGAAAVENIPPDILARWFVKTGELYTVRQEIRRTVVFGINNLVSDAPISRLDLITCRNVFIYLDAALQKRVLTRFHYALRREGLLVLGKAELIPFASRIFEPLDLTLRVYRKDTHRDVSAESQQRLLGLLEQESLRRSDAGGDEQDDSMIGQLYRDVLDSIHVPVVVTSLDGTVNLWNRAAASFWKRNEDEVLGKELAALGVAGLPGELLMEKTAAIRDQRSEHESVQTDLAGSPGAEPRRISGHVFPLRSENRVLGFVYVAEDLSRGQGAAAALARTEDDVRAAQTQLREWTEDQRAATEELETTNEELQSANEELQTTNEELESTNEELETTNEELQSTNAELDATNRELAARTAQMNLLGLHQRTIVRSLSAAVAVLDAQSRITSWNLAAERLLGIPEGEALGQSLSLLRIPALGNVSLAKIRRAVGELRPYRADAVPYELPGGATGFANVAAVPLADGDDHFGYVLIVEDTTRLKLLSDELAKRKPRRSAAKIGKKNQTKQRKLATKTKKWRK